MKRERIDDGPQDASPRERIAEKVNGGGSYFASPKKNLNFIHSGSTLLDLVLGGGWCEGRINNVIGDKSAGKTLHAIEASANFVIKYPKGKVRYRECESAFDEGYAAALGMPVDRVDFGTQFETVEDMFEDLTKVVEKDSKIPTLYIVDSLDALSDRSEMDRDMDEGTYGTAKAKLLSQLFRRLVREMANAQLTLMIISQVRSKIGVTFGEKTSRSGGRALDFYASQNLKLAQTGSISKTVSGQKMPYGIELKAKCTKNKVSLPYREAEYRMLFGYGIDDTTSCLEWMKSVGALKDFKLPATEIEAYSKELREGPRDKYAREMAELRELVITKWYDMELRLLPARSKY
jgi:recombination protein RecA